MNKLYVAELIPAAGEKTTRQREVVELQSELDKSKELWRTLKEENERLIPLAEANRTEDGEPSYNSEPCVSRPCNN